MTFPQSPVKPGPSEGARIWAVDVAVPSESPDWKTVHGIFGFQPTRDNTTADGSTFDDGPLQVDEAVGFKLDLTMSLRAKTYNGVEDAGQKIIREAAESFEIPLPQIMVRWYKRNGSGDANVALAQPDWADQGGGPTDLRTIQTALHIQSLPTTESNPAASSSKPIIEKIAPTGKGEGEVVVITGQFFSDASAVAFGASAATDFQILSGTQIVASLPAGAAGDVDVTVTNPVGTSEAVSYTRAV